MESFIEINGATLFVFQKIITADRPTLIFLHDSLGCTKLWRDFPTQLGIATNCNILIYDRQGYGKSSPFGTAERTKFYLEQEADTLFLLIKKCGIQHAILFGHSDGGSIALIAAAKYPDFIKAIVTEGAHIFVENITLEGIEAAVKMYENTDLKTRLAKYHGEKTDAVFKAWTHTWLNKSFKNWNIEHFLPKINCPALIIQGENDEYGTEKQVECIAAQVSGDAEKCLITAIGHTPHKEAQEIVLAHTASFLKRFL